jgi:hypothetical protein
MPRKIRPIRVCGDVAYITLTRGYETVIDAADVPLVDDRNWCAINSGNTVYAYRMDYSKAKPRAVYLHREIMGQPDGFEVDHKNGDGLANCRKNLRVATKSQNSCNSRISSANTSGFKGVSFYKRNRSWVARIKVNQISKYLGMFDSPEEAHKAYCRASEELHGEFGRTS